MSSDTASENSGKSFDDFYRAFGLNEYPFSVYTSENEKSRRESLFVDFSMYGPIIEGFNAGRTMILSGDRGTGKTAIIYDFCRKSNKNYLISSISDFTNLKNDFNSSDFYRFLISQLCEHLFFQMATDRKNGKKLTVSDKVLLSYFLAHFVKQTSKDDLHRKIVGIQTGPISKLAKFIYSFFRLPINVGANAAATFISGIITDAVGVARQEQKWQEFFPEINRNVDEAFSDPTYSFEMLKKLVNLITKIGYQRTVIIFDKIDEDARFSNAAEDISSYVETIATDNKLLTDDAFQVVLSLWIIPYNMLKDKVRTQKLFCPSVNWNINDLKAAADRRLNVFSGNKIQNLSSIFIDGASTEGLGELLRLANKNPRDLWHLLDKSFRAEYALNSSSNKISSQAIKDGINDFVCNFNFYEYYPRKSNARANSMDVYAYIKHLSKLKSSEFTKNQLNERASTGSSTNNYVTAMENIGLIERSGQIGGSVNFRVRDPTVVYAPDNQIEISRSS